MSAVFALSLLALALIGLYHTKPQPITPTPQLSACPRPFLCLPLLLPQHPHWRVRKLLSLGGWSGLLCGLLGGLLGFSNSALAQCTALTANMALPTQIAADKCVELQGGNVITGNTLVQGKLIVKAGRKAVIDPNVILQIAQGGELIVRGQLETKANSHIHLQDSSFDCQGMLNLEANSQFSSSGINTMRNIGRMLLAPHSTLQLTGTTSIRNSGQMLLDQAQLQLQNTSTLYSIGTITLRNGSSLEITQQGSLENDGRFNVESNSKVYASDQSHINNKKQWRFSGLFTLTKDAILENHAPLRLQADSKFIINQRSQILNKHSIEMGGQNNMSGNARMLNDGTLAIKKGSSLTLTQNATVINSGTYRNEGGFVHIDSKRNFINDNVIAGRLSREQGRYNQNQQRQTEEIELQTAPQYQPHPKHTPNTTTTSPSAQSSQTTQPQSQQSQQPQQSQPQQAAPAAVSTTLESTAPVSPTSAPIPTPTAPAPTVNNMSAATTNPQPQNIHFATPTVEPTPLSSTSTPRIPENAPQFPELPEQPLLISEPVPPLPEQAQLFNEKQPLTAPNPNLAVPKSMAPELTPAPQAQLPTKQTQPPLLPANPKAHPLTPVSPASPTKVTPALTVSSDAQPTQALSTRNLPIAYPDINLPSSKPNPKEAVIKAAQEIAPVFDEPVP